MQNVVGPFAYDSDGSTLARRARIALDDTKLTTSRDPRFKYDDGFFTELNVGDTAGILF